MFGKTRPGKTMLFLPDGRNAPFAPGASVLETAVANRIPIANSCDGMGSCGTCLVRVVGDLSALPAREGVEAEMALDRGFFPDERLACQLPASEGLCVRVPENSDHST